MFYLLFNASFAAASMVWNPAQSSGVIAIPALSQAARQAA